MRRLAFLIAFSPVILCAGSSTPIAYPAGYRTWAHVRSGLVGPASSSFAATGGLHHVYANDKALKGYRSGKFPDGSVIVFELLKVEEKDGVTTEGSRVRLDMMRKDSRRYSDTAGWGYERFRGDSTTDRLSATVGKLKCAECHSAQKNSIFGELRK